MSDEPGYSPEEIERGEDQAWHIPLLGCLVVIIGSLAVFAFALWLFPGDPQRFYLVVVAPITLICAALSLILRFRR